MSWPPGESGPRSSCMGRKSQIGLASRSRRKVSRSLSSRSSGPSSTPKTVRRITSRVIACVKGCTANTRPRGQRSIERSVASRIAAPYARMRWPWKGGRSSRRWLMWRAPSSKRTELCPSTGSSTRLAWPA
ncbi:MAG: hypothetical protein M5U28_12800 [Sandaracinaceae bacterium]|nr:hypothetical protein [Sandaracinaceae bacterium]